jgi:hypothetical protein
MGLGVEDEGICGFKAGAACGMQGISKYMFVAWHETAGLSVKDRVATGGYKVGLGRACSWWGGGAFGGCTLHIKGHKACWPFRRKNAVDMKQLQIWRSSAAGLIQLKNLVFAFMLCTSNFCA